jgi:mono/diheme cytochrome c family protein
VARVWSRKLLAAAALAALCGCGGQPDGRRVFSQAGCGRCHALAAASSRGGYGPDLDVTRPSRATVMRWLTYGADGMPSYSGALTRGQLDAVAAFVAASAGRR